MRIKRDSFIVVSDFHSYDWPLDIIENDYLKRFEKIYILGDATDRGKDGLGTNGVNLLLRIKKLSKKYIGRIIYIPGNHDEMLYKYAKTNDYISKHNIMLNNGLKTIEDIDNLKKKDPEEFSSLMYWLENLPIQKEHYYKGQRYVLAHALFNEKLFKRDPLFSLKDYIKDYIFYEEILWFRKKDNESHEYYDKESLPRNNSIMIIGHTPIQLKEGKNLDLKNAYGETIKVHCVDGGISLGGTMHKFDSNTKKVEAAIDSYNMNEEDIEDHFDCEKIFNNHILNILSSSNNLNDTIHTLKKEIKNKKIGNRINRNKINEYIQEMILYYSTKNNTLNIHEILSKIISKATLDYIIECLVKRYNSKAMAIVQLGYTFEENNLRFISNKVGYAREYASKIPLTKLKEVIGSTEIEKIRDYVNNNYGKSLIKDN